MSWIIRLSLTHRYFEGSAYHSLGRLGKEEWSRIYLVIKSK